MGIIADNAIYHIMLRAKQRYNIVFSKEDILEANHRLKTNCPLTFKINRNSNKVVFIKIYGEWYPFYYKRYLVSCSPRKFLFHVRGILENLEQEFIEKFKDDPEHPLWKHVNPNNQDENQI